jgi:4-amino-4-deoxy-L-arabinose transferase-like glycosyltransferase
MEREGPAAAVERSRWRWVGAGGVALRVASVIAVLGIVLFFGVGQFREKLAVAKGITFVGHSDEAAYASMGRSLAEGRGLQVNYISFYFIPYGREITRREDHWPPFMAFAIAPCFYFLGQAAWVAKIPAMLFGSVGLPLAAALLGYALSRRGYVAIAAALLMMAHPYMYHESMKTLSDVALAMLLAAFLGCALLARKWRWMHVLAGVLLAGAYYAKGSQVMLLALYPVIVLLACGWRSFRGPWAYAGLATAVVLMAPWWYSNYRLFGNPLHSTQNFVSGYYSFANWEDATYFPYWGVNAPKTSDRWTQHPEYVQHSREQLETLAMTMLTGVDPPPEAWSDFGRFGYAARDLINGDFWRRRPPFARFAKARVQPIENWQLPPWELAAVAAVGLVVWMMVAWPVGRGMAVVRWTWRRMRKKPSPAASTPRAADEGLAGPVAAVALVIVVEALFLAFFWAIRTRFAFQFLPLIAALGCTGASYLFEGPVRAVIDWGRVLLRKRITRRPGWLRALRAALPYWHVVLTIFLAVGLLLFAGRVKARCAEWLDGQLDRSSYPFVDEHLYPAIGEWLHKNVPNAVVMARNSWEVTFYDPGGKGITCPYPGDVSNGAQQIFAIARYYHVTHIFVDQMHAELVPYMVGRTPGLKRVKGAPAPLFEIEWTKIPELTVEQALGRAPLPPKK